MITYHTKTKRDIKLKDGSVIPQQSQVTVNFEGNTKLCLVTVHRSEFERRTIKLDAGRSASYFQNTEKWNIPGVFLGVHPSLTYEKIQDAVELQIISTENLGFCIACGHEQDGCEPDAKEYECDNCGQKKVYGAEELLMMMVA